MEDSCLAPQVLFSLLSYTTQDICPKVVPPTVALPRKCPIGRPRGQSGEGNSSVKVPSSKMVLVGVNKMSRGEERAYHCVMLKITSIHLETRAMEQILLTTSQCLAIRVCAYFPKGGSANHSKTHVKNRLQLVRSVGKGTWHQA